MDSFFLFILSISFLSFIQTQKFTEESPYMILSIMDLKFHEWTPEILNLIERVLDAELKYADEKKGIACKSIDFEPEPGYPKQNARFLEVSFRGICTDAKGKQHPIEKVIIRQAIIRLKKEVSTATGLTFFRIGNVQLYERDRNKLNLIIIPVSIGFIIFLFILTFSLRRMRYLQKHRHIVSELQKKREANLKKALTIANVDPLANDKQRLLQADTNVVGNISDTMGSSKVFTKKPPATRNNATNTDDHRFSNQDNPDVPPPIPSKENRPPYYNNRDDESSFQTQRPFKSSRERIHVPYESEARYSPTHHLHYVYETRQPEMLLIHEQQPRVVVRSFRDDNTHPMYDDPSKTFVSIPVQVEHSIPHSRFIPPPYHSDPYYPHAN